MENELLLTEDIKNTLAKWFDKGRDYGNALITKVKLAELEQDGEDVLAKVKQHYEQKSLVPPEVLEATIQLRIKQAFEDAEQKVKHTHLEDDIVEKNWNSADAYMRGQRLNRPEYWAWYDNEDKEYRYIYARRFQVEMCSPDGFKKAMEMGKGKIAKVVIEEVEQKKLDRPELREKMRSLIQQWESTLDKTAEAIHLRAPNELEDFIQYSYNQLFDQIRALFIPDIEEAKRSSWKDGYQKGQQHSIGTDAKLVEKAKREDRERIYKKLAEDFDEVAVLLAGHELLAQTQYKVAFQGFGKLIGSWLRQALKESK